MLDVNRLRVIDAVARLGSVTAAAKELHYSQPSVTHHLARLEAETGRPVAATSRPRHQAHAGRTAAGRPRRGDHRPDRCRQRRAVRTRRPDRRPRAHGRVRVSHRIARARAVATLADQHPGVQVSLTDTHPPEAIELLRSGKIEVALIFRYDESEPEPAGVRLHHLLDDSVHILSLRPERSISALRDATWIAGCERCRSHMLSLCAGAGFDPHIGHSTDDMVVMQALVAAGLGVATQTGSRCAPTTSTASSRPSCPNTKRHIYAATYGDPPDPPATAALLAALASAAAEFDR